MADNPIIGLIGRRLRLGLIGGGGGSMIGPAHRAAARMDDLYEITAGVLSSRPGQSAAEAAKLGIPRAYDSVDQMIAAEAARPDGIDLVAVMTPDDSHVSHARAALAAGLDVICEKPLSHTLSSAMELEAVVRDSGRRLMLMHNYSGFPMIREARAAVAAGEIGRVHLVHVSYLMGSLGTAVEATPETMPDRLKWRLDPARGGASHALSDIGTHAYHLLTYVTGLPGSEVLADLGAAVPGRSAHDSAALSLRLGGGARATILASKAATGASGGLSIEVYGDRGGLRWSQEAAGQLQVLRPGEPVQTRSAATRSLSPLEQGSLRRLGGGDGFMDAFANLYADFAGLVAAGIAGTASDPLAAQVPSLADGLAGLRLIEACLASSRDGGWVRIDPGT